MAPSLYHIPVPLLDTSHAAANGSNSTFDSPDWKWDGLAFQAAYVPYICEIVLVLLVFILWWLDRRRSGRIRLDDFQDSLYEMAPEQEFADWRSQWQHKFPDLFADHAICTICFDPISDQEVIRGLSCLHVFHKDCMDAWFAALHVTCPLCKQNILMLPSPRFETTSGEA